MYDVIVIGAGPAGLTAAIYARRAEKTVLVLEKETFGGQITHSPKVENYPGFIQMSGNEFAEKLIEQALHLEAEIELDEAKAIEDHGDFKRVICENGSFDGRTVILATGSKHRQLGVARENDFVGAGVSYCAVCDGAFYRGKTVAVIGGGNTALQEAVMLSDLCKKVTLVQNLAFFTGEQKLLDQLKQKDNVDFITSCVVDALNGGDELTGITIRNTETGETRELTVDGIFVAIGQVPENEPFKAVVPLNEWGYIVSDESCAMGKGVFVAGDCRTKQVRQIATAISDGAVAAVAACRWLDQ
ncbi:MAG: FAD-dependent oxidoreductase [Oscillospiraceae bacterium]|jgi:thioredoxin reductase (NADPH)|nr:FAD-dependent oxidoreductase [Clostridia bacterium]MBQ6092651.1 FAD-dependent oxidoreductase [Clostridia bacterium]MBR3446220.1 FAD-dependent oxidoreductase [Oscillospiraceae bacterium]